MIEKNDGKIDYAVLRDGSIAAKITAELTRRGIACGSYLDEQGIHHLYVLNESDFAFATDYFRVAIGVAKPMKISPEWEKIRTVSMGSVTYAILVICIIIFGLGYMMKMEEVYTFLMFNIPKNKFDPFSLINQGQVWRLFTPALIHFGFMHVLFNLLWWKDLAKLIETHKGSIFLLLFLIVTGIFSNILQAIMVGANFGGLSGVVYALLGFIWIYKLVNKNFPFQLPKSDVMLMIGWFVLCLFDVFPFGVANWAHGGGLAMGMILGGVYGLLDRNS
jgi:GlpG protein